MIIAAALYHGQPKIGASTEDLVSVYDGDRTRILIVTFFFGLGFLNLMWFPRWCFRTSGESGRYCGRLTFSRLGSSRT